MINFGICKAVCCIVKFTKISPKKGEQPIRLLNATNEKLDFDKKKEADMVDRKQDVKNLA